ncbi:MAG TPA: MerR family transcriptional regulator [Pseudonocardia sp.]
MSDGGGTPVGPPWTAGDVARHLGIATSTLRSWNRRYRLGPTGHQPGQHRRYATDDIVRLEAMCRLVARGAPAAAAAQWVLTQDPERLAAGREPSSAVELADGSVLPDVAERPGREAAGLVAAALRLDTDGIAEAVSGYLEERGVVRAWEEVCLPAVTEVGRRGEANAECMDAQFVLSWTLTAALHRIRAVRSLPTARGVVLACAENERHTLGLDALRAALAERGVPVRMLGAAPPAEVVLLAARRTAPGAAVVWSQTTRTARPAELTRLLDEQPRSVIVAAGPGWRDRPLPIGVERAGSLRTALLLLLGASQPAGQPAPTIRADGPVPVGADDRF